MSDTPPNPLAPEVSPLTEADPDSINKLIAERINAIMNTAPLDLSIEGDDSDLRVLIAYHRRERARFIIESQNKAASPRAPGRKKVPTSVADAMVANADLV